MKCAKVLTRFPSSGKLNVIRFVIDSEPLAPPDSPPEICCTFDCVSLRYKVAPQCNELFIICRRFASLKKITFCSGSGRPPRRTLGGNAFKRTSSIREEERRDARRGPRAKKVDASLFLFPLFIRKMHLAAVFSKLIYVNKGGIVWVHFKKKKRGKNRPTQTLKGRLLMHLATVCTGLMLMFHLGWSEWGVSTDAAAKVKYSGKVTLQVNALLRVLVTRWSQKHISYGSWVSWRPRVVFSELCGDVSFKEIALHILRRRDP